MIPGEVIVFVQAGRGKPSVSTVHLECDTIKVHAAMDAVGRERIVKERVAWPSKQRAEYVAALRKRGLKVMVVDNGSKVDE